MKRKLIYVSPLTEDVDLVLENACLQTISDINVPNPDNPMPWDND